ncbi:hypothetical protein M2352_002664 [Azospirillum fermentarium]|uniref:phasin family protein n=1 Tax=Azospirillum fermentarium TaxID=1233114 RepID=UPI002226795C|nr:phasin family protein [Azospirillum fermentarium]MCW2247073.1 hypothetical protein [Azospirillum fermentarium]
MAFEKNILERDIAATTRKAAEAVRNAAAEPVQRMAEPVQRMAEPMQRQADTLTLYNAAMVSGLQSLWQEWVAMSQETMDRRMDAWSALVRARDPQSAFAVQSQWLKDEISLALNHGIRLTQTATAVARDAAERAASR